MRSDLAGNPEPPGGLQVLVMTRTCADAGSLARVLVEGGFETSVCEDLQTLCARIPGAATAVIGEESLGSEARRLLTDVLRAEPEWSDFPLIVIMASDEPYEHSRRLFEEVEGCAHPILLQRPARKHMLLSAVRAAVRARARQHQVRDELAHRRSAEEALREADRRKDEFLATLGHELRNPLASMTTALEVTALTDDAARVAKSRAIMERQVYQLTRLVDDLLEVSRITRGKLELESRPITLATVVHGAVEDLGDAIDEYGHELTLDLPDDPVLLQADPVRLGQVFANLISNAVKYTPPGGRLTLSARREAGGVAVYVRDTGVGLAEEELGTIFEMFGQVGDPLLGQNRGLGIGLNLVKSLVELHGGTIEVASEGPGLGSEFRVWLPLSSPVETAAPEPSAGNSAEGGPAVNRRRVLLAEDNEDAAMTLAGLVELLGHEIRVEHDGEAALAAAAEFRPDVVLLDLGLPKLSGYEVARRLREAPGGDDVVLAAVTGWSQESHRERARAAGIDLYLSKPLKLETLRELLDSLGALPGSGRSGSSRIGPAQAGAEPSEPPRRQSGERE